MKVTEKAQNFLCFFFCFASNFKTLFPFSALNPKRWSAPSGEALGYLGCCIFAIFLSWEVLRLSNLLWSWGSKLNNPFGPTFVCRILSGRRRRWLVFFPRCNSLLCHRLFRLWRLSFLNGIWRWSNVVLFLPRVSLLRLFIRLLICRLRPFLCHLQSHMI